MDNWYDLSFIQKLLVLALPICFLVGVLMNVNAKSNKNTKSTPTNTQPPTGDKQ